MAKLIDAAETAYEETRGGEHRIRKPERYCYGEGVDEIIAEVRLARPLIRGKHPTMMSLREVTKGGRMLRIHKCHLCGFERRFG